MVFDSVNIAATLSKPGQRYVFNRHVLPVMSKFAFHPGWIAAAD